MLFACLLLWASREAQPEVSNGTQNAVQSGAITETQECVTEVPRPKDAEDVEDVKDAAENTALCVCSRANIINNFLLLFVFGQCSTWVLFLRFKLCLSNGISIASRLLFCTHPNANGKSIYYILLCAVCLCVCVCDGRTANGNQLDGHHLSCHGRGLIYQ